MCILWRVCIISVCHAICPDSSILHRRHQAMHANSGGDVKLEQEVWWTGRHRAAGVHTS